MFGNDNTLLIDEIISSSVNISQTSPEGLIANMDGLFEGSPDDLVCVEITMKPGIKKEL